MLSITPNGAANGTLVPIYSTSITEVEERDIMSLLTPADEEEDEDE